MKIAIDFLKKKAQHSEYDWADISVGDERVGKARCKIDTSKITICTINIYPEFEGHGYGREFVEYCKSQYKVVVADRVKYTAIGFWEAVGFLNNNDGSWIFKNN